MVQQRDDVIGHDRDFVIGGIVELCGIAVAAIVQRDDAAAVFLQIGNPGRIDPVDVLAGGEAVHENDRIALTLVEIGNFDVAVVKARHQQFHVWGIGTGDLAIRASLKPVPFQGNCNGRGILT